MINYFRNIRLFDKIKDPLVEFVRQEAFGGIVLIFITITALILANSSISDLFIGYWEGSFEISFRNWTLKKSLIHWINDGLMAIFFFVVGMEIKRELYTGALSSLKVAALPMIAALGGIIVPASIYLIFNMQGAGSHGWGIPMATDIAFALGILTLLGERVPVSLKLLLTSIAIVDDIAAVVVIALYYTNWIDLTYLIYGGGVYAILWALNLLKIRNIPIYMTLGLILWYTLLKSGVHATLAGVLLAMTIPAKAKRNIFEFVVSNTILLEQLADYLSNNRIAFKDNHNQASIRAIERNCLKVISPLNRLENLLHPWVAYLIIPLFAFANAGVTIDAKLISNLSEPVAIGIILGLFLGKPIGIFLFAYIAERLNIVRKQADILWGQILGIGFLGGIGFTMSFFVSQLAFTDYYILSLSKLAILIGSLLSGVVGFFILRFFCQK